MGLLNNFGEYDAKAEAAKRKALVEEFLASEETHLIMIDEENKNESIQIK